MSRRRGNVTDPPPLYEPGADFTFDEEEMTMTDAVSGWMITFHHKQGDDVYLVRKKENAERLVDQWVTEWWSTELGDVLMPSDREMARRYYFEHSGESYEINRAMVTGTPMGIAVAGEPRQVN